MKKVILAGAVCFLAAGASQAGLTSWGTPSAAYSNDTTWVSTAGTLVSAINASASANDTVSYAGVDWTNADATEMGNGVTQNGVTMAAGSSLAYATAFGPGTYTDTEDFYNGGIYNFTSLTISGLTVGQEYQLQVMAMDDRGTDLRYTTFSDGVNTLADSITGGTYGACMIRTDPAGGAGVLNGTFTADSATQTFEIFGSRGSETAVNSSSTCQFNAMQLRAIPEPATLGLVAAFGGAVLFIRRRFMM